MFKQKKQGKKLKISLLTIIAGALVISCGWFFTTRYEGEPPRITIDLKSPYIRTATEISGRITDEKTGLDKISITIVNNGRNIVLKQTDLHKDSVETGRKIHAYPFSILLDPKKMGLSDGKARLFIKASDNSWKNGFKGNESKAEKNIFIDTQPPAIQVLSRQHNMSQGGSGLVIYRLSEQCPEHGVYVGNDFFPGHEGYFKDPNICLAFFALGYNQGADTRFYIEAKDPAGNISRSGFYHHINLRRFKKEALKISDSFLSRILPRFYGIPGLDNKAALIDQFLYVNKELRKKNNEAILAIGKHTDPAMHWSGAFKRLPNSARRANFADHRSYTYKGKIIDHAVHLGIDLASVHNAPVPAANTGRVAFVGPMGIYGNLVCIDHGFGLFSIYAHLSSALVKEGDMVQQGDIIAHTDSTGLAGGDHLHFGMFIDHKFVNPVEWWDAGWIKNNVLIKLSAVKDRLNAESKQPVNKTE
ncbi:MAG: M23 family metallopeptidase [Deltaproteobacteria bacterium]|nr:M23 family metallopeptidase [Deltaproteobacteria bacterium]